MKSRGPPVLKQICCRRLCAEVQAGLCCWSTHRLDPWRSGPYLSVGGRGAAIKLGVEWGLCLLSHTHVDFHTHVENCGALTFFGMWRLRRVHLVLYYRPWAQIGTLSLGPVWNLLGFRCCPGSPFAEKSPYHFLPKHEVSCQV